MEIASKTPQSVAPANSLNATLIPQESVAPTDNVEMKNQNSQSQQPGGSLLIIDDDTAVLSSLTRLLRLDGYKIFTASSPEQAKEINRLQSVSVILCDQKMPGTSGTRLMQEMDLEDHQARMILSGDYDSDEIVSAMDTGAIYKFLTKPWNDSLLRANVREAFRYSEEKRNKKQEIEYLASKDQLTGLPHISLLDEWLSKHARKAEEQEGFLYVAAIKPTEGGHRLRLDGSLWKQWLSDVVEVLGQHKTLAQHVFRLSETEFAIIDSTNQSIAEVRASMQDLLVDLGAKLGSRQPMRIGLCIDATEGVQPEQFLVAAREAVYGLSSVSNDVIRVVTADLAKHVHDEHAISQSILTAIKNNEFSLAYQPQIDLNTRRCQGVEALIRWNSPEFGFVSPDKFIPLAERFDSIHLLGEWVLRAACQQLHDLRQAGHNLTMAINVSPVQLMQMGFAARFAQLVVDYGLTTSDIDLEITEAYTIGSDSPMRLALAELSQQGFKLAIDDFGAGATSLSYFGGLPFSKIKYDRSLVGNLDSPQGVSILNRLLQMSKELGLFNVIEGIETQAQLDKLVVSDADAVQGYFFSRPLDADALLAYLNETVDQGELCCD